MERVAIFASIGLSIILVRTWIVVERAEGALLNTPTSDKPSGWPQEIQLFRAEWQDQQGIMRVVETRGMSNESTESVIHRHQHDLQALSTIFPPR